jgi:hypothetical protein
MSKKAIFVFGPESSGTRMVTRMILDADGVVGSAEDIQPMDQPGFDYEIPRNADVFVLRRSFPHNNVWVNIMAMATKARSAGYVPIAVVTTRDWIPMQQSAFKKHVKPFGKTMAEGIRNIQKAYVRIFAGLDQAGVPFQVVSYEAVIAHPDKIMDWLCQFLGLTHKGGLSFAITNENEKYYQSQQPLLERPG